MRRKFITYNQLRAWHQKSKVANQINHFGLPQRNFTIVSSSASHCTAEELCQFRSGHWCKSPFSLNWCLFVFACYLRECVRFNFSNQDCYGSGSRVT
eukprot:scaffold1917_cov131-Skeletonema_marinoi.AAC.4